MKNLKFLSMMLMLMVSLVSFSSCSDDDDDANNPLIGTWVQNHVSSDRAYATFTFKSNGTGSHKVTETETNVSTDYPFSYSYSAKDEILSIAYNDGDIMRCNVSVTGKTLVLNFSDDIISLTRQ